jgi:uncharacterized Ntn-hydrolase superfamily protein
MRAHTYSIIAIDKQAGLMGIAVQSHWFSVGSIVTWAEAGVGVIATQAFVEPGYGALGLALLREGKSPDEALRALLHIDNDRESRQVAMLDVNGNIVAHTGKSCIPEAGHVVKEGVSAQGNMMSSREVWNAMAEAYLASNGEFAERLLAALEAGERAGGDIRGRQSAAMLVVRVEKSGPAWRNKVVDLRVDDSAEPLIELKRLLRLNKAYHHADKGDEMMTKGMVEKAMEEYEAASRLAPEVEELAFWQAVNMLAQGMVDESIPIFRKVFKVKSGWRTVLSSLPTVGLLKVDEETLTKILKLQ